MHKYMCGIKGMVTICFCMRNGILNEISEAWLERRMTVDTEVGVYGLEW